LWRDLCIGQLVTTTYPANVAEVIKKGLVFAIWGAGVVRLINDVLDWGPYPPGGNGNLAGGHVAVHCKV